MKVIFKLNDGTKLTADANDLKLHMESKEGRE